MHTSGKRRAMVNHGVAAGSVWDTRIKMDEFEGGVKVFNSRNDGTKDEKGTRVHRRLTSNRSQSVATADRRKRRNWKPQEPATIATCIRTQNCVITQESSSDQEEADIELEDKEIDVPIEKEMNIREIHPSIPDMPVLPNIVKIHNYVTDICKEPEIAKPDYNILENQNYVTDTSRNPEIAKPDWNIGKEPEIAKPDFNIVKNQNYVTDSSKEPEIANPDSTKAQMFESTSSISDAQTRIHNIVDLIMWRDISKSAFVFGFGNFILLSSSYAKDLNLSLIQAISYLCLVYLAMIFLYKSILGRGSVEFDERDKKFVIGEEEAIWVLRFLLPYVNEVLLKIRVLFSGNPATTMKLALLLFVLARCGGSISTCTLSKLVFCGVFAIPKLFSCYHVQLAKYVRFWLERLQDGWESCTHKKAVVAAVFSVVWIVSSPVARIWAVFMLVITTKLYQQCAVEQQRNIYDADVINDENRVQQTIGAPTENQWDPDQ